MAERISSIIDLFDKFETEEDCVRYIYELRIQWNSAYYLLERIRAMMAERGCLQRAFRGARA